MWNLEVSLWTRMWPFGASGFFHLVSCFSSSLLSPRQHFIPFCCRILFLLWGFSEARGRVPFSANAKRHTESQRIWSLDREDPEGRHGNSLQYCLGELVDRGAWRATILTHDESDMPGAGWARSTVLLLRSTTFCVSVHQVMGGVWAVSILGLLKIMLLWTFVYKRTHCMILFIWNVQIRANP